MSTHPGLGRSFRHLPLMLAHLLLILACVTGVVFAANPSSGLQLGASSNINNINSQLPQNPSPHPSSSSSWRNSSSNSNNSTSSLRMTVSSSVTNLTRKLQLGAAGASSVATSGLLSPGDWSSLAAFANASLIAMNSFTAADLQAYNFTSHCDFLDATFTAPTLTDTLGWSDVASANIMIGSLMQISSQYIVGTRYEGRGITLHSTDIVIGGSSSSGLAALGLNRSRFAALVSFPATSLAVAARVSWITLADSRLMPYKKAGAAVSMVFSLHSNVSLPSFTVRFTPFFSFASGLRCASLQHDVPLSNSSSSSFSSLSTTGWILGPSPTTKSDGTLTCTYSLSVAEQWTSFSILQPALTSISTQLVSLRSAYLTAYNVTSLTDSLAVALVNVSALTPSMSADDWSFSVNMCNSVAEGGSGTGGKALSSSLVDSLFTSTDTLALAPRGILGLVSEQYSSIDTLRSTFQTLGIAQLKATNNANTVGQAARSTGSFVTVETVKVNASLGGYNFTVAASGAGSSPISFTLPAALTNFSATLSFVVYKDDRLFTTLNTSLSTVASVVSASIVDVDTSRLTTPATFSVPLSSSASSTNPICAYFDEDSNTWSTLGMKLLSFNNSHAMCSTWHLTDFTVLVDASGAGSTTPAAHAKALEIITIVGCSLSLLGLLVTMGMHLFLADLRRSPASQLLLQLCAALTVALALFLVSTQASIGGAGCQALGIFLHYAWLSALAWMVVEAVHLHALIVIVLGLNLNRRMRLYTLSGWGIPAVIVGVTLAVGGPSVYGGSSFCWINSNSYLIGAFMVPLALAMAINAIMFVIVIRGLRRSITQHRKRSSISTRSPVHRQQKREIRATVSVACLLGLAWLFGGLIDPGNATAGLTFQYIFAICVSLQGFAIFLFYCLWSEPVKNAWGTYRHLQEQQSSAKSLQAKMPSKMVKARKDSSAVTGTTSVASASSKATPARTTSSAAAYTPVRGSVGMGSFNAEASVGSREQGGWLRAFPDNNNNNNNSNNIEKKVFGETDFLDFVEEVEASNSMATAVESSCVAADSQSNSSGGSSTKNLIAGSGEVIAADEPQEIGYLEVK